MTQPFKPYLFEAFRSWCLDSGLTPHAYITPSSGCELPPFLMEEALVALNLQPAAVQNLAPTPLALVFQTRFSGSIFQIVAPWSSVVGLGTKEHGLFIDLAEVTDATASEDQPQGAPIRFPGKPFLASKPETRSDAPIDFSGFPKRKHLTIVK